MLEGYVDAKIAAFHRRRAALLAAPQGYRYEGVDLAPYFGGAVRYVRPDGTSTGSSGGLTDTTAGAWNVAQFVAQQGTLAAHTRVVFTGNFLSAHVQCTANDLLLDCRDAVITQGVLLPTWVDQGNGEWRAGPAIVGNNGFTVVTEDYERMEGFSATSATVDAGRLLVTAVDTATERVTLTTGYPLVDGDSIALITGTLAGVAVNTWYYVVDAQAWAGSSQAIGLSLTPGGAKVDLTAVGSGNRFFFSLFSGRHSIPVPGSLKPGQFAFAPWEDAVYVRPSSGTINDHTYHFHQNATGQGSISLEGARTFVLGGVLHTNARLVARCHTTACIGSGFLGTRVYAGEHGLAFSGAIGATAHLCWVSKAANHGLGSFMVADPEPDQQVHWCLVQDTGTYVCDWGDWQALVTNPESHRSVWKHNIIDGAGRPQAKEDQPANVLSNSGALVLDSSNDCEAAYNVLRRCYGEQIELGPNDVSNMARNKVHHNFIDMRGLEYSDIAEPRVANLLIIAPGSDAFGHDDTNLIANNLVFLPESFGQRSSGGQDAGVWVIRVATANTVAPRVMKLRNNIVIGKATGNAAAIYVSRRTVASYDPGIFDSEGNIYAVDGALVAMLIDGTSPWPDPSGRTDLATLAEWRASSGQDLISHAVAADAIKAWLSETGRPLPGSPALTGGADLGYVRDLEGRQSRRHIGAFGAARITV